MSFVKTKLVGSSARAHADHTQISAARRCPSGTKLSVKCGRPITSCGVPSLDHFIGGGLALGTVTVVVEDAHRSYAQLLCRYFLAEGVYHEHATCVVSADDDPKRIMKNLPTAIVESDVRSLDEGLTDSPLKSSSSGTADMQIAWRYRDKPSAIDSEDRMLQSNCLGHNFDTTQTLDVSSYIANSEKYTERFVNYPNTRDSSPCESGLQCIRDAIGKQTRHGDKASAGTPAGTAGTLADDATAGQVLRIVVTGFGTSLWGGVGGSGSDPDAADRQLCAFLWTLRALARQHSAAVALVTLPAAPTVSAELCQRLLCLGADYAFGLTSLQDPPRTRATGLPDRDRQKSSVSGANPAYSDQHGLLQILKLPFIDQLCPIFRPDTCSLAFKALRKRFVLQRLHLPPDLSDVASRTGCGTALPSPSPASAGNPHGDARQRHGIDPTAVTKAADGLDF